MDIEVVNAEQFREIMRNMKSRFHDIIKDYSTLHIYQNISTIFVQVCKHDYFFFA